MTGRVPRAPQVVCLHGLLESPAIWRPVRRALSRAGVRSIALPLPGHRRDAPDFPQTRMILAGCGLVDYLAARIAQKTGGAPVHLLGHSLGGLLALLIARAHPGLVDRVMVVGAPHAGHAGHLDWFDPRVVADIPLISHMSARVLIALWLADPERFESWMQASLGPDEKIAALPETMRRELRSGCPYAINAMIAWLRAQDALAEIDGLEAPVTVLVGADDPVVTPEHQMALLRALPNARATIMRCGHLPMLSAPDQFERAVLQWALAPDAPDAEAISPEPAEVAPNAVPSATTTRSAWSAVHA